MEDEKLFNRFYTWLQKVDPRQFVNESDVREKFVAQLFFRLGYPEKCYRPDFPIKVYEPSRRGRKPEIDQAYFSTEIQAKQDADTCLVIVEAKSPIVPDLDDALGQAYYYAYRLNPFFLVVTNAYWVRILKVIGSRNEEIMNASIEELQKRNTAQQLYRQLLFATVKRLKAEVADGLTHALHIDIMHLLDRYPDLHAQLAKGDFTRRRSREGRCLTVIEPKIAMICDLPLAFGDGACRIEFSSILLRGLTIHLSHQQILTTLMLGLGTLPSMKTRRFLREIDEETFKAHLGQTTVMLSLREAHELCYCVDEVCSLYRTIISHAENVLETWEYMPVAKPRGMHMHGFHILTVQPWLWILLHRFAHEFDALSGNSPWHIFDAGNEHIRVIHDYMEEALLLYPSYNIAGGVVELLYCIDDDRFLEDEGEKGRSWEQRVGPKGRWTARYAESWLVDFISEVIDHYEEEQSPYPIDIPYWKVADASDLVAPSSLIGNPKKFAEYVKRVHHWLHELRNCSIAASLLEPYYVALTNMVRHVDPAQLDLELLDYCHRHLLAAQYVIDDDAAQEGENWDICREEADSLLKKSKEARWQLVEKIIEGLDALVWRIARIFYENPRVAEYFSCVVIALLEHGSIHCDQEQFNAARDVITPLLERGRFEERYVLRSWE